MTILEEAQKIIKGARAKSYGDSNKSLLNISKVWSGILGTDITPEQVALCMSGMKLVRENSSHKRDNLVDAAGYLLLLERKYDKRRTQK